MITTPESRLIVIQPFDPSTTGDIERALGRANSGSTRILVLPGHPATDSRTLRGAAQGHGQGGPRDGRRRPSPRSRDTPGSHGEKFKAAEKGGSITEDDQKLYEKDVQN